MALKKAVDFGGVTVANAYHRIHSAQIPSVDGKATIFVFIYKDAAARDANAAPLSGAEWEFAYDPAGTNLSTQGYAYLKTQPEYSGAEDA